MSTTPGAASAPVRLRALDGIRLLAALSVLLYHYVALGTGWGVTDTSDLFPLARPVALYGWLGVEVFFLVSGFVICMSAWGRPLGDFVVSRVSRLFPAYWCAVLLTAAVLWFLPGTQGRRKWGDVLVNLSMLQEGVRIPHVDHAYWSLYVELTFYALFAVVVLRGLTYHRVLAFCTVWTAVAVLAPNSGIPLLYNLALPQYAPYFIAGVLFHLMHRFRPTALLWGLVAVQFLIGQAHVRARMNVNLGPAVADALPTWPARLALLLGFALMAALALGRLDRIRWRWLTTAGALTYPLYLIHMVAGMAILQSLRGVVPPVPLVCGLTVLMLVCAHLIHRFAERPLTGLLRTGLRKGLAELRAQTPARSTTAAPAGGRTAVPSPRTGSAEPGVPAPRHPSNH
ncbi:acyltransferase family protein (plasmid) [Streptomyces sp. BI20]|uniref:acyltransferase family protein n=1 Tax=Streptomyces sp. BI20 TaxID=3403460 RepID=UPI003C78FF15